MHIHISKMLWIWYTFNFIGIILKNLVYAKVFICVCCVLRRDIAITYHITINYVLDTLYDLNSILIICYIFGLPHWIDVECSWCAVWASANAKFLFPAWERIGKGMFLNHRLGCENNESTYNHVTITLISIKVSSLGIDRTLFSTSASVTSISVQLFFCFIMG